MQKGIESGAEGTEDGRFYFHLGDALQREGRTKEAYEVSSRNGFAHDIFLLYNYEVKGRAVDKRLGYLSTKLEF